MTLYQSRFRYFKYFYLYFSWYSRNHPTGSIFVWFETSNWWIFVRNRGGSCQTKGRRLIREFKERETNCWTVAFNKPEEFWFIIYCVNNLVKWCQCSRKILLLKFLKKKILTWPIFKVKICSKTHEGKCNSFNFCLVWNFQSYHE